MIPQKICPKSPSESSPPASSRAAPRTTMAFRSFSRTPLRSSPIQSSPMPGRGGFNSQRNPFHQRQRPWELGWSYFYDIPFAHRARTFETSTIGKTTKLAHTALRANETNSKDFSSFERFRTRHWLGKQGTELSCSWGQIFALSWSTASVDEAIDSHTPRGMAWHRWVLFRDWVQYAKYNIQEDANGVTTPPNKVGEQICTTIKTIFATRWMTHSTPEVFCL